MCPPTRETLLAGLIYLAILAIITTGTVYIVLR